MSKPKLLDLFCCQGGASRGYADAGFDVYGVDIGPQPRYPFPFHQADALGLMVSLLKGDIVEFVLPGGKAEEIGLDDIAAIHASPPCQSFLNLGAVNKALGRGYEYPNLIRPTRDLLVASRLTYVIENVENARNQLNAPARVCGTGLGRPLRRHRLFESNIALEGIGCDHSRFTERRYWTGWRPKGEKRLSTVVQVYGNAGGRREWPEAMGIDWMDRHGMVEAIPPAYTEHIGRQLMAHIREAVTA